MSGPPTHPPIQAPAGLSDSGWVSTHTTGRKFEDLAARFLLKRGWIILGRNVRHGRREVDLIVRRGSLVAFVEVKGRRGTGVGHPLEAITWKKRQEIERVAQWWIHGNGAPGDEYRLDAIAITPGTAGGWRIEHVEDAWRIAWRP